MLQVMCRKRMSWWIFCSCKAKHESISILWPIMVQQYIVSYTICSPTISKFIKRSQRQISWNKTFGNGNPAHMWCCLCTLSWRNMMSYQACFHTSHVSVSVFMSVSEGVPVSVCVWTTGGVGFSSSAGLPCPEPGPLVLVLVLVQALPGIAISQLGTSMSASLPRWCSILIIARSWLHPPLPLSHCAHSVWSSALFRRPISLLNDRQDLVFFSSECRIMFVCMIWLMQHHPSLSVVIV